MRGAIGLAILVGVAGLANHSAAQAPDRALGKLIRGYATTHAFNGTVLVEHSDRILFHESFGLADRAFEVPAANDTRYRIASITKAFTAVLVLQLHDAGRLDLSAPISAYLPSYSGEAADVVAPHHLLNHTSGIENFDTVRSYEEAATNGMETYQLPHTSDELLAKYASGSLVHEVGTTFAYNNADYVILGKIVEAVAGRAFEDVLQAQVLGPLDMKDTGLARQRDVIPRLAPTYYRPDEQSALFNDLPVFIENWYAAGGMYSTSSDLLRFARALFGGTLVKPETLELMLTAGKDDYGYGLWIFDLEDESRTIRVAQRPGSVMGANGALLRLLDETATVIILSNTNLTDIDAFSFEIARALSD